MRVLPRLSLVIAAIAAWAAPAPLLASPHSDAVETAVFDLCPRLRAGTILGRHPTALTRLGYRRVREEEEDETDAEDGAPFIFRLGRGADAITLRYWAFPELCSVVFGGDAAASAAAQLRTRIAREPLLYQRVAEAERTSEAGRNEAWRVARPTPACLTMGPVLWPEPARRYAVSLEPFVSLHPGMAISACDPASIPH
jgi:hypothetical protein